MQIFIWVFLFFDILKSYQGCFWRLLTLDALQVRKCRLPSNGQGWATELGVSEKIVRFAHKTFILYKFLCLPLILRSWHFLYIGAQPWFKLIHFVRKKTIFLNIWDTAGQERFHALGPIYYRCIYVCNHRLINKTDRTLDVVFSRFRGFSFTITLRQRLKGVTCMLSLCFVIQRCLRGTPLVFCVRVIVNI